MFEKTEGRIRNWTLELLDEDVLINNFDNYSFMHRFKDVECIAFHNTTDLLIELPILIDGLDHNNKQICTLLLSPPVHVYEMLWENALLDNNMELVEVIEKAVRKRAKTLNQENHDREWFVRTVLKHV